MSLGFSKVFPAYNEPVLSYAPGSAERAELKKTLSEMRNQRVDVPMYIGGLQVRSNDLQPLSPPHDHQHILGHYHKGQAAHVQQAIDAALAARARWSNMPWEDRAAIFLKAADLLAGPWRARMNAATMLGQSKNAYQAEIDSACELIDFWRFNVAYIILPMPPCPISLADCPETPTRPGIAYLICLCMPSVCSGAMFLCPSVFP